MQEDFVPKAVLAVVLTLILSVTGCSIHTDRVAERLVLSGQDPIKVSCLLSGMSGSDARAITCHEAMKQ